MIKKISILKSNFIGVYARAWEDIAFLPVMAEAEVIEQFRDHLGVDVRLTQISSSNLIGSLMVMNSNGLVVNQMGDDAILGDMGNRNVLYLKDKVNAVGNDILANDRGAIIHRAFSASSKRKIEDALGVEVIKGSIGGIKTVGSAAVLTKKGLLVTPEATEDEIAFLSEFFKVPAKSGTANFGNIYIGSSVVANSKGIFVGRDTTPIEIGRIDDVLS
ncbi:MAG: translation initiation factor IF-6 [Thermoplasmataceae archaeon]